MELNSVSKSCPHWANRPRNSVKQINVSFRVSSISCATERESFSTAACSGVTSKILTRVMNNSLLFLGGIIDIIISVVAEETEVGAVATFDAVIVAVAVVADDIIVDGVACCSTEGDSFESYFVGDVIIAAAAATDEGKGIGIGVGNNVDADADVDMAD